jgi:hypothetical protein
MPREIKSTADVKTFSPAPPSGGNDFKDRLVKLIPSEIVTAYVTIQGLIAAGGGGGDKTTLMYIVIGVLFGLTPVYLMQVGNVKKVGQIVFTSVAFLIWVLAIGSPVGPILGYASTFIGSIVLVLYTLLIPMFYKG